MTVWGSNSEDETVLVTEGGRTACLLAFPGDLGSLSTQGRTLPTLGGDQRQPQWEETSQLRPERHGGVCQAMPRVWGGRGQAKGAVRAEEQPGLGRNV